MKNQDAAMNTKKTSPTTDHFVARRRSLARRARVLSRALLSLAGR
jgi:hypothetical protein